MAVKAIAMENIKFKELAAQIKVLNDSKLLEKPIATVGASKEILVAAFMAAVLAIPDDAKGDWTGPNSVAEYYQKITIADVPATATKPGKPAKAPKAEKAPKEPKEPKPAKERKKGRLFISAAVLANASGQTVKELTDLADAEYVKEGGKANDKEASWAMKTVLASVEAFDILTVVDGTVTRK